MNVLTTVHILLCKQPFSEQTVKFPPIRKDTQVSLDIKDKHSFISSIITDSASQCAYWNIQVCEI